MGRAGHEQAEVARCAGPWWLALLPLPLQLPWAVSHKVQGPGSTRSHRVTRTGPFGPEPQGCVCKQHGCEPVWLQGKVPVQPQRQGTGPCGNARDMLSMGVQMAAGVPPGCPPPCPPQVLLGCPYPAPKCPQDMQRPMPCHWPSGLLDRRDIQSPPVPVGSLGMARAQLHLHFNAHLGLSRWLGK